MTFDELYHIIYVLQNHYFIYPPIIKMSPDTYRELQSCGLDSDILIQDNVTQTYLCGLEIEIDNKITPNTIIICKNDIYWKDDNYAKNKQINI